MKLLLVFSFFSWMLACSSGSSGEDQYQVPPGRSAAPSMDQSEGAYSEDQGKEIGTVSPKIIRDGRMTINVDDVQAARQYTGDVIARYKGRTSGEQFENNDYQATYYIRIRVPADRLDSLAEDLGKMKGTVASKSLDARDVTEEYIDLETRLANKRSYLEQYRQLLKGAKTTEDVLKVTEQIRQLEEELESVEGRLRFIRDQVAMSTLELTLIQTKDFVYRPGRNLNFSERLKQSLSGGWYGFVDFMLLVLRLWPFWILIAILWFLVRRMKRKKVNP